MAATTSPVPDITVESNYFSNCPTYTDVFKTSSGYLKNFTTSCDQTRRLQDVWQKTSYLELYKDEGFTAS